MNYRHVVFILCILLLSSRTAHAAVIINEIAWMGTAVSANDEWIELYNTDSNPVSLEGWTLTATDGSPVINLTGTITANNYYLAERTDDSSVPGTTAGVIYSGSLSNTGETLVLKDNTNETMDTVSMTSGWVAGNSDTKETMQRNGASWITNTATPAAQNTVTSNEDPIDDPEPDESPITLSIPGKPKTVKEQWEEIVKTIEPDSNYSVSMIIPEIIVAQVPVQFSSEITKFNILKSLTGKFEWSMGDGQSFSFNQSTEFTYTYQRPGTYIIMVNYYSNVFKLKPDSTHKIRINVLDPSVTIQGNSSNSDITLTNGSSGDMDLKDWKLQVNEKYFQFAVSTILEKGSSIIVPQTVHGLTGIRSSNISLLTPSGFSVKKVPVTNPTDHKYYQTNTIESPDLNQKEGLFEEPQTATITSLDGNRQKGVYLWFACFAFLIILLPTGFTILVNRASRKELLSENT